MITATELRQKPLLGQRDLRGLREAAARIANIGDVALYLPRDLSRAELQLLALCGVVCEIVVGEFGKDGNGDPIGDLTLKARPQLPAVHQPRLTNGNGNGTS